MDDLERRIDALPRDVQLHIFKFVPFPVKPKPKPFPANTQRLVEKLQASPKRTPMDLKGLEDFVLK